MFNNLSKKNSNNQSSEHVTNSEIKSSPTNEPMNRNSIIIRAVVIVALAYFAVTEFILKETPKVVVEKKQEIVKSKKNKQAIPVKESSVKNDEVPTSAVPIETQKIAEEKVQSQPPVEEVNVLKKQDEQSIIKPAEIVASVPESEVDKKIDQLIDKEDKKEDKKESVKTGEKQDNISINERPNENKAIDLKDKIVEENYIAAPSYEVTGRGLVYNCKEKFWACINKPTYIQCNKNMKWTSANNKPTECAVVNIYNSNEDCEKLQKYNVSSSQPTPFCK